MLAAGTRLVYAIIQTWTPDKMQFGTQLGRFRSLVILRLKSNAPFAEVCFGILI